LEGIFSLVMIAQDTHEEEEKRLLVACKQVIEGAMVAGAQAAKQFGV
jgi:hypothetical protein